MNIAKLNTASFDDKTFIIKRGTSGGSTPDTPSGGVRSSWRYFDISAIDTSNQDAKDFVKNTLLALWAIGIIKGSGTFIPCTTATAYTYVAEENYKVYRVGFDGAQKMMSFMTGEVVSCEEIYNLFAATLANYGGIEITKEQFYDLNA